MESSWKLEESLESGKLSKQDLIAPFSKTENEIKKWKEGPLSFSILHYGSKQKKKQQKYPSFNFP